MTAFHAAAQTAGAPLLGLVSGASGVAPGADALRR
jgi:hypothetical protein